MESFKVRVKKFKKLPPGFDPLQKKYMGKIITVQKIPIAWMYVQIDPKRESLLGKWIYAEEHIEPVTKGKRS